MIKSGGLVAGALADVRVLDLASEIGLFAGRMLGELGADVIRVEPPGGSPERERGPFLDDEPGIERSLYHQHFNANKRGITLDLTRPEGTELFRDLATRADIVIETFEPGTADALGIGFEALRATNPALLYTTITPFGQVGPMRRYRGNDLIGAATSGLMWLNGFPDDPPNQPGAEQAYHMASMVAAANTLIALYARDRFDEGRRIDVSMQEATSMATLQHASANAYTWHREVPSRRGMGPIYQCADSLWISINVPPYRWDEFLEWLRDEQIECELFAEEWRDPVFRLERPAAVGAVVAELAARHPRSHIFHEGQRRRLLVMPTNTVAELVEDEQLRARGFFVSLEHEALDRTLVDTGAAYQLFGTPALSQSRAPVLGEHNDEVFGELLQLSKDRLATLRRIGVI